MNKKTQTLVVLGLVAVGGYMWWKSRQESSEEMSEFGGRGRRRKYDDAKSKMCRFCARHPESPQCKGINC
jgi:hypothetical protein